MQQLHDDIRVATEIFARPKAKSARKQQKGAARRAYRAKTMENTGTVIDGVDRGVDS